MRHGTHMNESWHTYEWVMAHIWMSHGTHMNESWHTYEWDMSHIWMRHVTYMNESWHTYEWVISHMKTSRVTLWMSLVTQVKIAVIKVNRPQRCFHKAPTSTCAMTHPWLHTCDMTHSSVQCESFLLKEPYILTKEPSILRKEPRILPKEPHIPPCPFKVRVRWLIYNFMCVRWPIHDSVRVTWVIHMCDMTRPFVWHDYRTCDTPLRPQGTCVVTHPWLHTCDMTHSSVQCESFLLKEPHILPKHP